MAMNRSRQPLVVLGLLSALIAVSCASPPETESSEPDSVAGILSPRIIESQEEAFETFAVIADATLAWTSIPKNQMLMTYIETSIPPRVSLHAPDSPWLFELLAMPIGGVSDGMWQIPTSESSQLLCPGYIYDLVTYRVSQDFPDEYSLDEGDAAMIWNIVHSNMSPDLWIGEARNNLDDVTYPTDVWAVTPDAFLAMHRESGTLRIFTLNDAGMITSFMRGFLSLDDLPGGVGSFLDQFTHNPGIQNLPGEPQFSFGTIVLTAGEPDSVLVGTSGLGVDWWLSAADRLDELRSTITSDFWVFDYDNAERIASEQGLQFAFSSEAVRIPDGEVFSLIAMAESFGTAEPLTVITFEQDGSSPALDSQGTDIVCEVAKEFLGPPTFDSANSEPERFFVE